VSGLGTKFRAESNDEWDAKIRALSADMSSNPLNKPPGEHDPFMAVWPKACGAGKQKATFTRKLELLGRPATAGFTIAPVYGSDFANKSPLRTWALTVNGSQVAKGKLAGASGLAQEVALTGAHLGEFRDGDNNVKLTVSRAALPAGMAKCNTSESRRTAVSFSLFGDYAADLALFEDEPPVIYRGVDEEGFASAQFHLTVRNDGPSSAIAGADFTILTSGVPFVAVGSGPTDPDPPPPFDTCTKSTSAGRFDCTLTRVKRDDSGYVYVGMAHNFGSDQITQHQATLTWRLYHPADPTGEERSVTIVFCGALATDPGCAGAS
jgi:hypothetical protein